jgi:hypothetical protein
MKKSLKAWPQEPRDVIPCDIINPISSELIVGAGNISRSHCRKIEEIGMRGDDQVRTCEKERDMCKMLWQKPATGRIAEMGDAVGSFLHKYW